MTTQELEDRYPDLSPKEQEDAITRELGAVFLMQIGGILKSGKKHDGRAPDYDDWSLNGDILLYYPVLDRAFEVSSMGCLLYTSGRRPAIPHAGFCGTMEGYAGRLRG